MEQINYTEIRKCCVLVTGDFQRSNAVGAVWETNKKEQCCKMMNENMIFVSCGTQSPSTFNSHIW